MQKIRANLDGFRCRIANELGELFDTHLLLLRDCVGISVVCQIFDTNNRQPGLGPPYTTPPKYRAQPTPKLKAARYTTHSSLECKFIQPLYDTRATRTSGQWIFVWKFGGKRMNFTEKLSISLQKRYN